MIAGVFLICWVPFFSCNMLDALCTKLAMNCSPGVTVFNLTSWLGYMNSFVNPIIYTVFNPEFRRAFRKLICCCETKKKPIHQKKSNQENWWWVKYYTPYTTVIYQKKAFFIFFFFGVNIAIYFKEHFFIPKINLNSQHIRLSSHHQIKNYSCNFLLLDNWCRQFIIGSLSHSKKASALFFLSLNRRPFCPRSS